MATISSAGLGSGLDVQSIVSKLIALEQKPIQQIQARSTALTTQLSAWGTVKSQLSSLQEASQALMSTDSWGGRTFSSTLPGQVTGSASSAAGAGSFSVQVSQLAVEQKALSSGLATDGALGTSGSLQITLGSWSGNSFTGAGSSVNVNISATDTLRDIAEKINSSDSGVVATVVSANGQDRIVMRSSSTGLTHAFEIRTYDGADGTGSEVTSGAGVGILAFANDGVNFFGMSRTQVAANALASIEGVDVSSESNTVSGAVAGLKLELKAETTEPVIISVGKDTQPTQKAIEAWVNAYNTVVTNLAESTKYDPVTGAGKLQGDATAVAILNTLRGMVAAPGPSTSTLSRMSDAGIEIQRGGTLSINQTKLNQALVNTPNLQQFFVASSTASTTTGMARRFNEYVLGIKSTDGLLSNRNDAINGALSRNQKDVAKMQSRVAQTEARLYASYSALDTKMASLNALSTYVTQQVQIWGKS